MSVPGVEWSCLPFQIKVCETCQHAERSKNLARTVRPLKVEAPWDIVGIDFIGIPSVLSLSCFCTPWKPSLSSAGPFPESRQGNTSVAVLIDYFSKWPEAFPVQRTDALSVARCVAKGIYR